MSTTLRHSSFGQPAKPSIHQLYADTRCHLEDLPKVMMIGMDGNKELIESMLLVCIDDDEIFQKFQLSKISP